MTGEWLIAGLMLVPLFFAGLGFLLEGRVWVERSVALAGASAYLILSLALATQVLGGSTIDLHVGGWEPPFGILLQADAVAGLVLTAFALVNLACVLYSFGGEEAAGARHAYYPLFQVLLLGCSGAVLSRDLFNVYVWFEGLLIGSFVLLAFGRARQRMQAALVYVTVNLLGSVFYLLAVALAYGRYGALSFEQLGPAMREGPVEGAMQIWALLLLFLLIKMAAFPFFAWLPTSYPRPPLAVGALFSGLLTKVALVVLLRLGVALPQGGLPLQDVILIVGILTLLTGTVVALVENEGRRIAAWLLVGEMGYLLIATSAWTADALAATLYMLLHMALATATLFLVMGLIESLRGRLELKGPALGSALVAALYGVTAAALAGLPPSSGFIGKVAILRAVEGPLGLAPFFAVIVGSLISLAALARVWRHAVWGESPGSTGRHASIFEYLAVTVLLIPLLVLVFAARPIYGYCLLAAGNLLGVPT